MRLTCPNCDAQYEVDDRAIPEGGRDVQCSNCGHAWFQLPAGAEEQHDEAAALADVAPALGEGGTRPDEGPQEAAAAPDVSDQVHARTAPESAGPESVPPESPAPEHLTPESAEPDEGAARPEAPAALPPKAQAPAANVPAGAPPAPQPPASEPPTPEPAAPEPAQATSEPPTQVPHPRTLVRRPSAGAAATPDLPEEDDEEGYAAPPAAPAARRRELDESILSVLREEAQREKHARQAEGIEVQPDLGLSEPALASDRIDRLRAAGEVANEPAPEHEVGLAPALAPAPAPASAPEAQPEAATAPSASRRDLLPDIEEINSTLRPSSERGRNDAGAGGAEDTPAERRRGFRLGFGFALIVVAVLAVTYTSAPRIRQQVPAAAPMIDGYVRAVDRGRAWVNRALVSAVKKIDGKTAPETQ